MERSNDKLKGLLERKIQLIRDSRHTKLYWHAILDYHEYICGTIELNQILREIIAEDRIVPVYLQDIFNDFLTAQYMKYDVPKEHHYPNFYTQEVEQKYKLMRNFAELIQSEYDATRAPNKIIFNPNAPIIKTERDEEFFYTQKLHNDIIEKLDIEKPDPLKMIEHLEGLNKNKLDFDEARSVLFFMGKEIQISQRAQSDPHDLLVTIFKDRAKIWNTDEVLEDWKLGNDPVPQKKVYQAGKAVNRLVAQDTQVKDFLVVTTKNVSINKKYLNG